MNRLLNTAVLAGLCTAAALGQAYEPAPSQSEADTASSVSWQNDLDGFVQAQIRLAQTHLIDVPRKIFDPVLVPDREALVVFEPRALTTVTSINMVVQTGGQSVTIAMAPPEALPKNAVFDQENTFSGRPIEGNFPRIITRAFTAMLPGPLVQADMQLTFEINNDPQKTGTLSNGKLAFLANESEGLVLMNIKGCIFRLPSSCRTVLDQFDMQKNPELATIAAREMFSELPVKQLVLGMGQSHWPYIIAKGPDGRPHRYSTVNSSYREWAEFGDKTLPAKVGMGNYWRAASDLGYKQPGKFVAITGQLLDVPDDIPVLPPGVAASCGGNSCNYPWFPDGYWHETGHGLGLPHNTPPRYEGWAWRSYDLRFLPNTHPNPSGYGLGKDHLDLHYFGHVMGSLREPAWPDATASAPLVDEFEQLRHDSPGKISDWKRYIAPYTHQQMLRVQPRFGRLPDGQQYAEITDDHRQPPAPAPTPDAQSQGQTQIDTGIAVEAPDTGSLLTVVNPGEQPIQKGVPVHTLVVSLASSAFDAQTLSQIYPPIISNYGNVFAPNGTPTSNAPASDEFVRARIQSVQSGKCLALVAGRIAFEPCEVAVPRQLWSQQGTDTFRLMHEATQQCVDANLQLKACANQPVQTWRLRKDLTGSDTVLRLQNEQNGKFVTPGPDDSATMQAMSGAEQHFYAVAGDAGLDRYTLQVRYLDGGTDNWSLYSGFIPDEELFTVAINVPSARQPRSASLARDGQVVNERVLQGLALPPPVVVGGSEGYPVVIAELLRSEESGKCLTRVSNVRVDQRACDPSDKDQLWGFSSALGSSVGSFLLTTGVSSKFCMQAPLKLALCDINSPAYHWSARQDLVPSGLTMLQNSQTGTFITTAADGHSVSLQAWTHSSNQQFRRVTTSKSLQ